jgi:hypothetical protein
VIVRVSFAASTTSKLTLNGADPCISTDTVRLPCALALARFVTSTLTVSSALDRSALTLADTEG